MGRPPHIWPRLFLVVTVVGAVVGALAASFPGALARFDIARLVWAIVIVALIALRLAASTRPVGPAAKQLAVFIVIGAVLMVGYSYKNDLNGLLGRALGTVVPSRGVQVAPGMMRFTADDTGQFAIDATVNGVAVHFLMDTGASGIALSRRDADRLGFDPKALRYSDIVSTANGMTRAAPVMLDSIQIGPLSAESVHAWVNQGDLDQSLLGTLGRIEIKGDTLILER